MEGWCGSITDISNASSYSSFTECDFDDRSVKNRGIFLKPGSYFSSAFLLTQTMCQQFHRELTISKVLFNNPLQQLSWCDSGSPSGEVPDYCAELLFDSAAGMFVKFWLRRWA
jgi:hypothetical protein